MERWYGVALGLLLLTSHAPSYAQSSLDLRVAGDAKAAKKIVELRRQQQSSVDPKKDFEMFLKCSSYSIGHSNPEDFVIENGKCYSKPYKNTRIDSIVGR